jgi:hypothetical protein
VTAQTTADTPQTSCLRCVRSTLCCLVFV